MLSLRGAVSVLATITSVVAAATPVFPPWHPPGPGDVRSPCPGLNTLANHGVIPHNGKHLTISILTVAFNSTINVDANFAQTIGSAAISLNPNKSANWFDLNMLDQHNQIEHDFSLSRGDAFFGDNHTFNQTIFNTVLAFAKNGTMNIKTGMAARAMRQAVEKKRDPKIDDGIGRVITSQGETALYLSVLGDAVKATAPVSYIKMFFEQEKLPYELGWRRPKTTTTLGTLTSLVLANLF